MQSKMSNLTNHYLLSTSGFNHWQKEVVDWYNKWLSNYHFPGKHLYLYRSQGFPYEFMHEFIVWLFSRFSNDEILKPSGSVDTTEAWSEFNPEKHHLVIVHFFCYQSQNLSKWFDILKRKLINKDAKNGFRCEVPIIFITDVKPKTAMSGRDNEFLKNHLEFVKATSFINPEDTHAFRKKELMFKREPWDSNALTLNSIQNEKNVHHFNIKYELQKFKNMQAMFAEWNFICSYDLDDYRIAN